MPAKKTAKIVVITGVSQGLGRAMTTEFIQRGHTVLGCARSEKVIEELRSTLGAPHDFYAVDVSSDEAVKSWASICLRTHGPPDIVVNNAGIINKNAPLWDVPAREFGEVVDVNLKGTANVIRHFAPGMVRQRAGVIVNFSSGWGRSTDAEVAPYCATKWAIEGLTQALAQELPSGMASVALNPGIIDTAMLRSCFGGSASSYPAPEEWAKAAVPYILSFGPDENGKQLTVPIRGAND